MFFTIEIWKKKKKKDCTGLYFKGYEWLILTVLFIDKKKPHSLMEN